MLIFIIALALLCIWGLKINIKNGFADYMSPSKTASVKGIFVIIVLLSHVRGYITLDNSLFDNLFNYFINLFGQLMVVMFLFYSGYGVFLGLKNKENYVKTLPVKRAFKVLIHFDIAVLIFYITGILIGRNYSVKTLLLSLIGIESVGNSVWFIVDIILLYLLTYAVFVFTKKKMVLGLSVMSFATFALLLVIREFKSSEYWWYDTLMCYPLGMWFGFAKPYIDKNIFSKTGKWVTSTAALAVAFGAMYYFHTVYKGTRKFFIPMALVFALLIVFVTMRVGINNRILQWFGKRVFGTYILQRIPMIVLSNFGANDNPFIFTAVCFAITVVMAEIFERATDRLDTVLGLAKKK